MVGLLLGCGLRRSEVVGLNIDQLQSREGHWVIVDLVGKGARLRTVPVPSWSKKLIDAWLRHSGVSDGKVFRQVFKGGVIQRSGVTANVVWYAVKRCAGQVGISNLAPHDLRRTCARLWPRLRRRTRTDSVFAWPRFCADNGTIYRQQTEASGCGERSTRDFGRKRQCLKGLGRPPIRVVGDSVLYHAELGLARPREFSRTFFDMRFFVHVKTLVKTCRHLRANPRAAQSHVLAKPTLHQSESPIPFHSPKLPSSPGKTEQRGETDPLPGQPGNVVIPSVRR
jgi:hypothetical protein